MTDKIVLADLGAISNSTDVATINANFAIIEAAFNNTFSRDGTAPNQMSSTQDANSHRIVNLPAPVSNSEPLRLQDLQTFKNGGTVSGIPAGGTTGQSLKKLSNADYNIGWA